MKKITPIILAAFLLVVGFFLFQNHKEETVEDNKIDEIKLEEGSKVSDQNPDTKKYTNTFRRFSLEYPKEMTFEEINEGGLRRTVLFSDKNSEKSFQIYFKPYDGEQIMQSTILGDVSSGKFTQPTEVVINQKIKALIFFSTTNLGEMREIWFIHDRYLYEITTYKELDLWLSEILKTWEFN